MKLLSRAEEIILIAITKLKDNAYGVTIRNQVSKDTGYDWPYGAVYVPLKQLKQRGYVKKIKGEPTPERGGKSKMLYEVTEEGKEALKKIQKVHKTVWEGMSGYAFD